MEALRLIPFKQTPLIGYTWLRDRGSISEPLKGTNRGTRYADHEGDDRRGTLGELMAKKVVGDVMIIQKNADARTHPRPPTWTRKDLDAQSIQ